MHATEGSESLNGGTAGGLVALFSAHRAELQRFLTARCGDPAEAEDLMQDLWIKASGQSGDQPGGPIANARAYLFRMANNLVLDRRRGQSRAMRRDRDWLAQDGPAAMAPEERPDPAPRADEDLERRQEAELLHRAIAALPPGAQRALRLHRLEGLPQGEVATVMGISRSGVEKHLAVAMRHLKIALRGCGPDAAAASHPQGRTGGSDPPLEQRP